MNRIGLSICLASALGVAAGVASVLAQDLAKAPLSQPPPYGWTLTCGDKPEAVVWVDAPPSTPPAAVSAWLYWGPTNDISQALWARAEGGGKIGLYVALPHGVYLWPAWEIAGVTTTRSHSTFCP